MSRLARLPVLPTARNQGRLCWSNYSWEGELSDGEWTTVKRNHDEHQVLIVRTCWRCWWRKMSDSDFSRLEEWIVDMSGKTIRIFCMIRWGRWQRILNWLERWLTPQQITPALLFWKKKGWTVSFTILEDRVSSATVSNIPLAKLSVSPVI